MRTRQLTPNLIQLTRLHFVNAYLVREEDGLTLVDTTLPRGADALLAAAAAAGASLRRIALTHGHGDHVGSLDELRERLGDEVEVLMPEPDWAVSAAGKAGGARPETPARLRRPGGRIHAGEHVVEGKLPGSWPTLRTKPDVLLRGGERVGSLEVVPAPGHTPGHVAFLDTRDRSLVAGDVLTTYGRPAVASYFSLPFPLAATATWDKPLNLASARGLRSLDPSLLAVGHGPAVREPGDELDRALARAARHVAEPPPD